MREGAQDYLFKTKLDGEVLSRTIRHAMERHDLSRRLRASEELWRRAVSRAPDAIWRGTLADQLITYVNEAACRILRAESDELLGRHWTDLLAPGEREKLADAIAEISDTGFTEVLTRLRRGDGSVVPVEVHMVDLGDGTFQAIGRDMTLWLEAQEALRRSEARFRLLLEGVPDPLWLADRDLRFLYLNDAAATLFQRPRDELLERSLAEFLSAREQQQLREAFGALHDRGTVRCLCRLERETAPW